MEYLESSGTQVVDTGIAPSLDLGIWASAELLSPGGSNIILFGCTESETYANGYGIGFDFKGWFYQGELTNYTPIPQVGEKVEIEMNYLNDGRGKVSPLEVDKAIKKSATYTQLTIAIFNFRSDDIASISRFAPRSARVYGFRCTRGEELILDLIPVVKNGVGYFYDTLSERLFGNVGTGDFIVGPRK